MLLAKSKWHYFIFFMTKWCFIVCVYTHVFHVFFISSSVDRYLGCFPVSAIINSAAVNIEGHISPWIIIFSRHVPSSGIAGSWGNSVFHFLMNLHTVLHRGRTSLHSHQPCSRSTSFHIPTSIHYLLTFCYWPFWSMWGDTSLSFWFCGWLFSH